MTWFHGESLGSDLVEGGNAFFTGVLVSGTFLAYKAKPQGIHPCPGHQQSSAGPASPVQPRRATTGSPGLLGKKAGSLRTKVTIITNGIG